MSSKLIEYVFSGARTVAVEYVDKTTSWVRPTAFPSAQIRSDFTQVVRENIDSLKPETTRVGMKYVSRPSSNQFALEAYTKIGSLSIKVIWTNACITPAFELDSSGNVIATTHFVRKK